MFIKIVRGDSETTYECSRFTKRPNPAQAMDIHIVELQLEGTPWQAIGVVYDARDTDVYVMNADGKTIETFRYPRPGYGIGDPRAVGARSPATLL